MADGKKPMGVVTYKMECGGLWLASDFKMDDARASKFQGKGLDSYDPEQEEVRRRLGRFDVTSPMIMEGTYDEATKTMTMTGEGPGPDGKPQKFKMVTKHDRRRSPELRDVHDRRRRQGDEGVHDRLHAAEEVGLEAAPVVAVMACKRDHWSRYWLRIQRIAG